MTKDLIYGSLILLLIGLGGYQQHRINQLEYYSTDNAVNCIGKVGNMTRADVDYCRPLLLKLGFTERVEDAEKTESNEAVEDAGQNAKR